MKSYFSALVGLLFPRLCPACGNSLFEQEEHLCTRCGISLPRTHFHLDPGNPVQQTFWGRAWLEKASACFYYVRGGRVQRVIHQVKYKGGADLGKYLGREYGRTLVRDGFFSGIDALVPVPLHPSKFRIRGFNQSEAIASGLSESSGLPVWTDILARRAASATQTRRTRYSRWQNVEHIFVLCGGTKPEGKHLLLVDDVITTGATLEACLQVLRTIPGVRLSVLALAYATR